MLIKFNKMNSKMILLIVNQCLQWIRINQKIVQLNSHKDNGKEKQEN